MSRHPFSSIGLTSVAALIALFCITTMTGVWNDTHAERLATRVVSKITAQSASPFVSLRSPVVTATVRIEGLDPATPSHVDVNPVTGYVYVAMAYTNHVAVVSGTQVIKKLTVGQYPADIKVNPKTGYVYAANLLSNTVTIISETEVITTVSVGTGPYAIGVNPLSGYVYVASLYSDNVTVLSGTEVIATVPTGQQPFAIGINPKNGYTYVPNLTDATVTVISGTAVIATIPVGGYPRSIGVNPTNGYVYVGNDADNTVSIIADTYVIGTVPVARPWAIAANPTTGYVYVVNPYSDTVTILSETHIVATRPTSRYPTAVGVNSTTGYVYVPGGSGITVLSGTQVINSVVQPHVFDFSAPENVAINPLNGYVYMVSGHLLIMANTEIIAMIGTGAQPVSAGVNPSTDYAYVGISGLNAIAVFSRTQLVASLPITTRLLGTSGGPIAVNPATGQVYVINDEKNGVVILADTHIITALNDIFSTPSAIGINPSTGYVYVGNDTGGVPVTILSGTQVVTAPLVPGWEGHKAIATNPNTGYVYITNAPVFNSKSGILVLSGTDVITSLLIGGAPFDVGVNPATGYVYVANNSSHEVTIISGTNVIMTQALNSSPIAVGVNPTTGYAYVVGPTEVTVLSGTLVVAALPIRCGNAAIPNPVSGYIYVPRGAASDVAVLADTHLVTNLKTENTPSALAVNPHNGLVYVPNSSLVNSADGTVTLFQEEWIAPKSLTSAVLTNSLEDFVIDFGEPLVTSTIQLAITPTAHLTVTWTASSDQAVIVHDALTPNVLYELQLQPGGQAQAGVGVVARKFNFVVLSPEHSIYMPLITRQTYCDY